MILYNNGCSINIGQ